MKKILLAAAFALATATGAMAQSSCANPMGKNGKELSGAAKMSSITKCCTKAANDQKLRGAAKTSNIDKCKKDSMGT
jgi:hypothetical protein